MAGFDPNQPRDNEGQWTDTGVSSAYKQASIKDMRRILEEKNISTSHIGTNRSLLEQRTMLKKLMEENELEVPFIQNIDKVEEAAKDAAGLESASVSEYRSGRIMALSQKDGTDRWIRFNQSESRYEYLDNNPYSNAWKPLQNIGYSFKSLEVVERELSRNKGKVRFL